MSHPRRIAFLLAGTMAAQPIAAEPLFAPDAVLPPVLAWHGASERLVARMDDRWITPAEKTGLVSTPNYAETRAWLERLVAASPLFRIESYGRSPEGRELYAVIASKGAPGTGSRKPIVLIQAGIHPGEIDGKDAGLMLLRDIAFHGKDRLLDGVDLVFVPIVSPDGHENGSAYSRPNQRGPLVQGWRTTGQNVNLNRDYAKADTPEMQGLIGLIRAHDPDLYLDIHVTDGMDYVHDITFSYPGWHGRYARSVRGGAWLDDIYRPEVERALIGAGHVPGPYLDPLDGRAPEKGIRVGADQARFSTGYGDARRIPTVLVETHSLKPYRQRVLGTYVLIEQTLRTAADHASELKAARAADLALRPKQVTLGWKDADAAPVDSFLFRPVARETYRSAITGRDEVRWLGRPAKPLSVPVFGSTPDIVVSPPAAYWVPATKPELIDRLQRHGIMMERIAEPRTVRVDVARIANLRPDPAAEKEGRFPVAADSFTPETREVTYAPGSVRIPTDQPLGELAAILLEPQSRDSFLAWGFFPEIMQRTEYAEGYIMAPLAERMMADDPALARAFQAKLAADPDFAASPARRLAFFYERTPYFDRRYLIYPVGREVASPSSRPGAE
ncbi:carboxypeptidase [Sphingomonas oleivorans]|uniref:Carboxypeptidase n=1 Tax=Sphingomonas oleivorans TaxID=1735121 RepID=A0A2T5G0K0_9SPHN|nr:M14 family metallopeptidase [Sphingomonas oleivorans]PTQ12685.1 carboxypeptidase [Sphingomonas oleivorans]